MKTHTIFYADQIYEEYEDWKSVRDLPDGAYALIRHHREEPLWYVIQHCNAQPINLCDVPKTYRLLALLLT